MNTPFVGLILSLALVTVIPPPPIEDVAQLNIHAFYGPPSKNSPKYDSLEDSNNPRWNFVGHCFLSFTNFTGGSLLVGHIYVPNLSTITIGTFPTSVHNGIFYNYETTDTGGWQDCAASTLSIGLTYSQILSLSSELQDSNWNIWTPLQSCASFASGVWNRIAPTSLQVTQSTFPYNVQSSINSITGHGNNTSIPSSTPIGYVDSAGLFQAITS